MFLLESLLLTAVVSVTCFALWNIFQFVYHQLTSSLRHLRGPKSTSWIYGNIRDIRDTNRSKLYEEWLTEYGNTMKYKGFFNRDQLFTLDTRAVGHVLIHTTDYQRPPVARYSLAQVFGRGLLVVEGAKHRQQRRIMNPAFGPGQISAITKIFFVKAAKLRDLWSSEIAKISAGASTDARIDVVPWLSRMTLDVIGLAMFNYEFGALDADGKPDELSEAFSTMFAESQKPSIFPILQALIPPLRLIKTRSTHKILAARRTMAQIGQGLLTSAKATSQASATEKSETAKDGLSKRDLLSLLVKANMATDIPESERLSDEDVLAQVSTFLVAGHETPCTALIWALYAMTQAPDVQTKLREELLSVKTSTPSMDDLMALPYLDAVVREILRLYPPIPVTTRIAMKDDVLPVEKPFTDKRGVVHDTIRINKGDAIVIPILAMNLSKDLWGPDAHEFRPERWTQIPEPALHVPGVWGHLLTFIGGPRACIGSRFGLVEMKVILFTLLRTFVFALAIPASEVRSKTSIVQRPVLRNDPTNTPQLPVLIRRY